MKYYIILILSYFLTGCMSVAFYKDLSQSFFKELNGQASIPITNYIKSLPYASLILSRDESRQALLILSDEIDGRLLWVDSVGGTLLESSGKIVKSYGFENDLEYLSYPNISEIREKLLHADEILTSHLFKLSNPVTHYLQIELSYKILGSEIYTRKIDDKSFEVQIIEESFMVPLINWEGKNLYWIDQLGQTWKTRQILSPNSGYVTTEILKIYQK